MMKSIVLLIAAASLVAGQNLTGTPDCALPCLRPAIAAICPTVNDTGCACAKASEIGLSAVQCLLAACNSDELAQAQAAGAKVCADYAAAASSVPDATGATVTPIASVAPANSAPPNMDRTGTSAATLTTTAPVPTGAGHANITSPPAQSSAPHSSGGGGHHRATAAATPTRSSVVATPTASSAADGAASHPLVAFAAALVAGVGALL